MIAQKMSGTYGVHLIGSALEHYLNAGILLADVHLNNIGRAKLPEYDNLQIVITDPGHAVPFAPQWATLPIIRSI